MAYQDKEAMNPFSDYMQLKQVNVADVRSAIELGCRTMENVFNRDDNDVAFMSSKVWPNAHFSYSDCHAESHIPGRHLNAMLKAQAILGVPVSEEAVHKHAAAAYYSFSGSIPLPLNRKSTDGKPTGAPCRLLLHNVREGMFALYALSCYRNDARADELMHAAIDYLLKNYIPTMSLDEGQLSSLGIVLFPNGNSEKECISGACRCIAPLVKYYEAKHYAPALELARALASHAVNHYPEDGSFDQERMGTTHAHSIACTLASLALLADVTNDMDLLRHVKRFYDNGLHHLCNEIGWAPEVTDSHSKHGRGEVNTSGDIVETALLLGKYYGSSYYEDAERIVRCHILPSQLRDVSFITESDNPDGDDRFRDVANRHIGAFGFPSPYGHYQPEQSAINFNMDIVGGAVSSLCEFWKQCVVCQNGIHTINMHFDFDNQNVTVLSPYTHDGLTVITHTPGNVQIRLPSWADPAAVVVTGCSFRMGDGCIECTDVAPEKPITVLYDLPVRNVTLHSPTIVVRAKMKGDSIVSMENEGVGLAFFPPFGE